MHFRVNLSFQVIFCLVSASVLAVSTLHAQLVADGATVTLSNVTNNVTGTLTVGTNGSFTMLNWLSLVTNQFGTGGHFSFTNSINPNEPQRYFRLRIP